MMALWCLPAMYAIWPLVLWSSASMQCAVLSFSSAEGGGFSSAPASASEVEAAAAADLASSASSVARVALAASLCSLSAAAALPLATTPAAPAVSCVTSPASISSSLSTSTIGTVLAAGLLLLLGAPEGVKIF